MTDSVPFAHGQLVRKDEYPELFRIINERVEQGNLVYFEDPEFYCHGQQCLDGECSPLFCKDQDS